MFETPRSYVALPSTIANREVLFIRTLTIKMVDHKRIELFASSLQGKIPPQWVARKNKPDALPVSYRRKSTIVDAPDGVDPPSFWHLGGNGRNRTC